MAVSERFRKKFKMNDFYTLIHSSILLPRILFLFPYDFGKDNLFKFSPVKSWIGWIISLIFNIIQMVGFYFSTNEELTSKPYLLLSYIRVFLFNAYSFLSIIIMNLKRQEILNLLNQIRGLEDYIKFSNRKMRIMFWFLLGEILLTAFTWIMFAAGLTSKTKKTTAWDITLIIANIAVKLLPEVFYLQLLNFVYLIGCCIDELQDRMKSVDYGEDISICDKMLSPSNSYEYRPTFQPNEDTKRTISRCEAIRSLREIYGKVHDLKEKINDAFSFLLLTTVASIFAEMVFFSFVNISLVQAHGFSAITNVEHYQIKAWSFTQTLKLFFTAFVCHTTAKKALRLGVLVHRLFSLAPNEDFHKELTIFSIELLHRNPSVTAAGFFNVDFTLLYSVMGAIAMYIIILMQFKFPENGSVADPVDNLLEFS